jgi:hypothetical protein
MLAQCSAPAPAEESIGNISEIEGAWDIVSFDGHRPARLDSDGGRHAYVNVEGEELSFAIECNYSGMRGRVENGRLVLLPSDAIQTEMGCGPEREARDEAFFAFMRGGANVSRAGADQIVLENGSVRLELERAEVRQRELLPTALQEFDGEWRAEITYLRTDPGSGRNLVAFAQPARADFAFSNGLVRMTFDCETVEARLTMSEPGVLQSEASAIRRTTRGQCRVPPEDRNQAASLLMGAISAERIPPSAMHLVAGDVRAVLNKR